MVNTDSLKLKKQEIIAKCEEIVKLNPTNRSCKYAISYLQSEEVKLEGKEKFFACVFYDFAMTRGLTITVTNTSLVTLIIASF